MFLVQYTINGQFYKYLDNKKTVHDMLMPDISLVLVLH